MNRSSLVKGAARIVRGSASFFSKRDFNIELVRDTFAIAVEGYGEIDQRDDDALYRASFEPDGRWTADIIDALWPAAYRNPTIGAGIFTDTDTPCAFHGSDGQLQTMIASAITRMPEVIFSAKQSLIGAVEITGIRGNNLPWSTASGLLTIGTGATFTDTGFATALIKTQPYTWTWGAVTGMVSADHQDGIRFVPEIQLQPTEIDSYGKVEWHIAGVRATVALKPVGTTQAQLLTNLYVQDTGAARGRSHLANAAQFTVVGADGITYLTIPKAALRTSIARWGSGANMLRNGEIGFSVQRSFTAGVPDNLFTLAAS